jgi:hypothetical protein
VFSELFSALMGNGGIYDACDESRSARLVQEGILVWEGTQQETVDLNAEPILAEALRRLGFKELKKSNDLIDERLASSLKALGPDNKGPAVEKACAWGLLRSSVLQPSLPLGLSLVPGVALPKRLQHMVARLRHTERVDQTVPFRSLFTADGRPRTDVVFFGFPPRAGTGMAYWVTEENGAQAPVLVLVQSKGGTSGLADAVRSVTPAWQFVETMQRAALMWKSEGMILEKYDSAALRRSLEGRDAFWAEVDKRGEDYFSSVVRVVVCTGDVDADAIEDVNVLNETLEGGQEVVLASLTQTWAGEAVARALQAESVRGRLTAPKDSLACELLPQTVSNVRATWSGVGDECRGLINGGNSTLETWRMVRDTAAKQEVRRVVRTAHSQGKLGSWTVKELKQAIRTLRGGGSVTGRKQDLTEQLLALSSSPLPRDPVSHVRGV